MTLDPQVFQTDGVTGSKVRGQVLHRHAMAGDPAVDRATLRKQKGSSHVHDNSPALCASICRRAARGPRQISAGCRPLTTAKTWALLLSEGYSGHQCRLLGQVLACQSGAVFVGGTLLDVSQIPDSLGAVAADECSRGTRAIRDHPRLAGARRLRQKTLESDHTHLQRA